MPDAQIVITVTGGNLQLQVAGFASPHQAAIALAEALKAVLTQPPPSAAIEVPPPEIQAKLLGV